MADLSIPTIPERDLTDITIADVDELRAIKTDGTSVNLPIENLTVNGAKVPISVAGVTATNAQAAIAELKANEDTLGTTKVDTTTQVIAGNGLTGGGDLSTNRTLNVAATDDSIVVAADSIKVNTVDALTSTSATRPLSAKQGKALDDKKIDKTAVKQVVGTSETDVMSQSAIYKSKIVLDDGLLSFSPIAKNYADNSFQPWTSGLWTINNGAFRTGKYFNAFASLANGNLMYIPIPSKYQIVGTKLRIILSYISNVQFSISPYFRNIANTAWVNNAGATSLTLPVTTVESLSYIERTYEAGVGYIAVFISTNSASCDTKIGSVLLYAEKSDKSEVEVLADTIYIRTKKLESQTIEYDRISINYGFGLNPLFLKPDGVTYADTRFVNDGSFNLGKYFSQFTTLTNGIYLYIPIPSKYQIVGTKLRIILSYISNVQFSISPYFRNIANTAWVNNAGATSLTLPVTTVESLSYIERTYEAGVGYIAVFISTNSASCDTKIGGLVLFGENSTQSNNVVPIIKTVKTIGGDYTSIRSAIESIIDATEANPYEIRVSNGIYNEIDIYGKDYVTVVGEDREGVIIYTDGLSTELSPLDYSYLPLTYGGIPINTIPKAWKHQWWVVHNFKVKNMTLKINQCKYVVHQDWDGVYESTFENCRLIREESYSDYLISLVGIGSRVNQKQNYIKCLFEHRVTNLPVGFQKMEAIFIHNWNNQSGSIGGLLIDGCNAINGHLLEASELGSNHEDIITIKDCNVSDKNGGVIYNVTPGFYIPSGEVTPTLDTTLIPYNLKVRIINSKINNLFIQNGRMVNGSKATENTDTMTIAKAPSSVIFGQAIQLQDNSFLPATIADSNKYLLVLEDGSDFVLCDKGLLGYGYAKAAAYVIGDSLYLDESGYFTKSITTTGVVAKSYESRTLASDGVLMIRRVGY